MVKKKGKKTAKRKKGDKKRVNKKFKRSNLNKIAMVASLLIGGIGLGMILSNANITGNVVSNSITNLGWIGPILLIAGLIGFFVANRKGKLEKIVTTKEGSESSNLEKIKVEEYEKIGGWEVSKEIPKEFRDAIKKYFSYEKGRIPMERSIRNLAYYGNTLIYEGVKERKKHVKKLESHGIKKEIIKNIIKKEENLKDNFIYGNLLTIRDEKNSVVDYFLKSSSCDFVSNPFIPYGNIWGANYKVKDYSKEDKEEVLRDGAEIGIYKTGGVDFSGRVLDFDEKECESINERLKDRGVIKKDLCTTKSQIKKKYMVELNIDLKNKKARIEPYKG